ncbi:hypothetical protein [Rhizobium leguminosarum]|nr:hypothetical protein [Rhizobium leguminosarum]MBP2445024.1 putative membrane-anchored protein [Rhizobium leguminosarum]
MSNSDIHSYFLPEEKGIDSVRQVYNLLEKARLDCLKADNPLRHG